MRLVLVRHGQTQSNTTHALDTAMPGANLDEVGVKQAQMLADNFEKLVGAEPSTIYVSPLDRTRQTAAPLERKFGITALVREGIREVIAGDLEMSTDPEDITTYLKTLLSWVEGDLDAQMPGGEDGWQTRARFGNVLNEALSDTREIYGDDSTVVIVAHGAISRFIFATLSEDVTPELVARFPMHNASTAVLEWLGTEDDPWIGDRSLWKAHTWCDTPLSEFPLTGERVEAEVSKIRDMVE
ncbi:MAG: histidine phosphatase family protein [Actinomycetaceae bacterium]|nr:histidine phosphatase family protein [Actinomycetaceae bacterium]